MIQGRMRCIFVTVDKNSREVECIDCNGDGKYRYFHTNVIARILGLWEYKICARCKRRGYVKR